jgi:hypothetical protein
LLAEDAILLSEIVDQIYLVTIHPASNSEHEELQHVGHCESYSVETPGAERPATIHLASAAFSHLTGSTRRVSRHGESREGIRKRLCSRMLRVRTASSLLF